MGGLSCRGSGMRKSSDGQGGAPRMEDIEQHREAECDWIPHAFHMKAKVIDPSETMFD